MWACPSCRSPLTRHESQWRCSNNHHFDTAKEGYVNLLLAHQKSSNDPGDNKQMIQARRLFLEQGYFAPLARSLAEQIRQHSRRNLPQHLPQHSLQHLQQQLQRNSHDQSDVRPRRLYDAGCGEGYYLQTVLDLLREQGLEWTGSGSDISRSALQMAAKKYPANCFAVASNFNLPVGESSQDVVMQIFAPSSVSEVRRILQTEGLWVQVAPGPTHLFEMKSALYTAPEQHDTDTLIPEGFSLENYSSLQYEFELPQIGSREQLLRMTPYFWSVDKAGLHAVLNSMAKLTADFALRVLRKDG